MTEPRSRAGGREWTALVVLLLPLLLVSMDVSVLFFAVPYITRQLQPSSAQQLWIFDIYGFVLAGMLITMGSLGDRIGQRRLLLTGAVAFSAASFMAAYASSAGMLIAARGILGIAGATLTPTTAGLIRNMFNDEKQRQTAIAIWAGGLATGVSFGPVISGLLLAHFWWGSVFLINIPFMVLLLVAAPLLVPEARPRKTGGMDFVSSVLSLLAILPIIYGAKEMATSGVNTLRVASLVVGLVFGVLFVLRQRRPDPMIDLNLLRSRAVKGPILTKFIANLTMSGTAILTAQYLQLVHGLSPLAAGLWSLVPSIGVGVTTPVSTILLKRGVDRSHLISGAFVLGVAAFGVMTQVQSDSQLWVVLLASTLLAGGMVVVMTLGTELLIGAAPRERAGTASAILATGTQFGGAMGMAVLGTITTAVYRRHITGRLPASVDADKVHAARQTLGGATVVAQSVPGRAGAAVLAAARDSFTAGIHVAAVTAAVLMALSALLSALFLRRVRPQEAEQAGAAPKAREKSRGAAPAGAPAAMEEDRGPSQAPRPSHG
ncbi:MFS transporter [Streptomyces sp. NBC_00448]|uniref:MFS transporter n=1 Tax=Streptomyces sp. NBC_00448 TaxID=2903652 RepID=UPI002E1F17B6